MSMFGIPDRFKTAIFASHGQIIWPYRVVSGKHCHTKFHIILLLYKSVVLESVDDATVVMDTLTVVPTIGTLPHHIQSPLVRRHVPEQCRLSQTLVLGCPLVTNNDHSR